MTTPVACLTPESWTGNPADIYFSSGYGRANLAPEERWCILFQEELDWQMPLVLRPLATGGYDALSPYGYSGVGATLTADPKRILSAWEETIHLLKEMSVVSLFLRRSPLVNQAPRHPSEAPVGQSHKTIALDLKQGRDSLWSSFQGRVRTAVRKAERTGLTFDIAPVSREDLAQDSDFRRLYESTMDRNQAAAGYYFDDHYYTTLADTMRDNLMLSRVLDAAGTTVAASLMMRHDKLLHYHLAGSDPAAARCGANNLLLWETAAWGSSCGLSTFHLGGGVSADDALWRFKAAFRGRELDFQPSGIVIDQDRSDALTRQRAEVLGVPVDQLDQSFFPLYRSRPRASE